MPKPLWPNQFSPGQSPLGHRRFLKAAAVAVPMVGAIAALGTASAHAQDYPSQPIRLVVPHGACDPSPSCPHHSPSARRFRMS